MNSHNRAFSHLTAWVALLGAAMTVSALWQASNATIATPVASQVAAQDAKVDRYHQSDPRFGSLHEEMKLRIIALLACQKQPLTLQVQADSLRALVEEEIRWNEFCEQAFYFRSAKWTDCPLYNDFIVTSGVLAGNWKSATDGFVNAVPNAAQPSTAQWMMDQCIEDLPRVHALRRMMMRDLLDEVFKVPTVSADGSEDRVRHIAPKRH